MLLKRNKIENYTFEEFKQCIAFNKKDIEIANKVLDKIRKNKTIYAKLVLTLAFMLHANINIYANSLDASLNLVGGQLVDMLSSLAKWVCIGIGIKNMSSTIISGGGLKRASTEGIQYLLAYLFIQFYPQLFDLLGKIKIK